MNCKVVSGLTSTTKENLVLDAGAFFKNFEVGTDTFDEAVAAGKLIGATKGGGSFSAVPTFRDIEIDGVRGAWKGGKIVEAWEVKIGVNTVEITAQNLKDALGVSTIDTQDLKFDVITGKGCISDDDYIDNITWIGNLSGGDDFVYIQIFNALNTSGIDFTFADKDEAVSAMEFVGHYSGENVIEPPFKIWYPKVAG